MATISGVTKIGGVATQSTVCVYNALDKVLVETKDTDVGGLYDFIGLDLAKEYFVMFAQKTGTIWLANTSYISGNIVRSTVPNGFLYLVTQDGTSGAVEPTWPITINEFFPDGTCILKTSGFTVRPTAHGPLFPI